MKTKTNHKVMTVTVSVILVLTAFSTGCENPLADVIRRDLSVSDIKITVGDTEITATENIWIFLPNAEGTALQDTTFTITNAGTGVLALDTAPVSIEGNDPDNFALSGQPGNLSLSGGETTDFTVSFSASATRTYTADVRISSNDPDEETFSFTIQATIGPDIHVYRGSTEIDLSSGSDELGTVYYGDTEDFTYTIRNLGTGTLELLGSPRVSVSGNGSTSIDLTQPASSSIASAGSVSFTLSVDPVNLGDLSPLFTIESNDADEDSATFTTGIEALLSSQDSGVTAIEGGYNHTVALKNDGTVWCWGNNAFGQLGDGNTPLDSSGPVQVLKGDSPDDSTYLGDTGAITALSAGQNHTAAIKTDGSVWCWGRNDSGQLGDSTKGTDRTTPVQVSGVTEVVAIACGNTHTMALKNNGTVWCWGNNDNGQLGDTTSGADRTSPVQVSELTDVTAIAAGGTHSVALKTDGTVWSWGNNDSGQLGDTTSGTDRTSPVQVSGLTDITAIAAGGSHSMALKSDGTVWCWGDNSSGQLGDNNDPTDSNVPVQVRKGSSPDDTIFLGDSSSVDVTSIAAGTAHSIAVKNDGTVWCWGLNGNGQLGDNSTAQRNTPVQVDRGNSSDDTTYLGDSLTVDVTAIAGGQHHTAALKDDGTVWCWGLNSDGQLGDGTTAQSETPAAVLDITVTELAAGGSHTAVLKSNGTVWCWGDNTNGQLGNSTKTDSDVPVQVSALTDVTAIAAGQSHTAALKSDGTVWCWGSNGQDQLGDGGASGIESTTPVRASGLTDITAIACGFNHTIALKSDGTVWCWGENMNGQLGDGNSPTRSDVPVQVLRGDSSVDTTYLGDTTAVTSIAGGGYHTIALKSDGTVWCWGLNNRGQLGDGNDGSNRGTPGQVLKGASSGDTTYLGDTDSITAVAGGRYHSIALMNDGTVWCWGYNVDGQLGDSGGSGTEIDTPVQVLRGDSSDDTTYLGDTAAITMIEGGQSHTIALKNDDTVWCWGNNDNGQLGDTTSGTDRTTPVQVSGLTDVTAIAAGGSHSVALKAGGTVRSWGDNSDGQLGDGSTTQSETAVQSLIMFYLE